MNAGGSAEALPDLFDFHCRHFYNAHYVFIFRDPLSMARSVQEFQVFSGDAATPFDVLMSTYVAVLELFILMLRNLPNVHIVFHEDMTRRTFRRLEGRLGVRLSGAYRYYDRQKVKLYDPSPALTAHGQRARLMLELHAECRRVATKGFDLVQIEQNSAHLSPIHLTDLGLLARRCEMIGEGFRLGSIPGGTAD